MPAPPIPSITGGPAAASATSEAAQSIGGVRFTGGAQIGAAAPGPNPALRVAAITKVGLTAIIVVGILGIGQMVVSVKKKG